MGDANLLRELHDAYVWEINAAVGEDRMDLVWRLADWFGWARRHHAAQAGSPREPARRHPATFLAITGA